MTTEEKRKIHLMRQEGGCAEPEPESNAEPEPESNAEPEPWTEKEETSHAPDCQ